MSASIRSRMKNVGHSVFSFSVPSTTILAILIYVAIFTSSIILYEAPPKAPPPSKQLGLDLGSAFRDLQVIAGAPHPYNSHANNQVLSYILSRVAETSRLYNNVHVVDDLISNATWCEPESIRGTGPEYSATGIYFEGDNILVKIEGRQPELEAVLLSAHFDSVSTAPGATDDGMGVATLLQLVDYFAAHTPKRTVIFNINNGEEDGLNGAHAFLEHQWYSLPKLFLNLEGGGSGGRALLFRTSSASVTRAFADVPHPHGSVLTSDAFKQGLIKSETDFSVYDRQGLKGLDLAFYRRRSFYHTKDDSVPSLGGKDSLWNMMEASLTSSIALTESIPVTDDSEPAVYFDVYWEAFAVFSLRAVFIINIIFLIIGPLLVAISVALVHAQGKLNWSLQGWLRLPFAFVLSLCLTFALAILFAFVNPYIVYSSGYIVIMSLICTALICLQWPLALLSSWRPVPQQKSILILEMYVLWWILLVFNTVIMNKKKLGGLYIITFFHVTALLALIANLLEHLRLPSTTHHHQTAEINSEDADVEDDTASGERQEENLTETTPLIPRRNNEERIDDAHEKSRYGFWILEFLLLVPFPVILTVQLGVMLLGALAQTLADGNSPLILYLALALISFLLALPLAPFAHNLHRFLPPTLLVILVVTGLYDLFAFPFSTASPLTVFFSQTLNLDTGVNSVTLSGLAGFIDKKIILSLPSTWNQTINCRDFGHIRTCQWAGLPPASVPSASDWLTFNASLTGPGAARISLKGVNTRSCRIYFDTPVSTVRVDNSTGEAQSNYPIPSDGITKLILWSRTWEREFVVSVAWQGPERLKGRVACGWAESLEGRIPAFAEVIWYLPTWAHVARGGDDLMEATRKFSV